jgi:hypothetical protein
VPGARITAAIAAWRARDVVSPRLLVTAIGLLGVVAPIALYYVIVGPTAGDRLASLGFAVVAFAFGLFSLWEAKDPELKGRPDRREPRP